MPPMDSGNIYPSIAHAGEAQKVTCARLCHRIASPTQSSGVNRVASKACVVLDVTRYVFHSLCYVFRELYPIIRHK